MIALNFISMLKILILAISMMMHPVHVSLTSIDHVPDTDSIKVFVKMYYDDFLLDYSLFDKNLDPGSVSGKKSFPADLMNNYLEDKVMIKVNNKQLKGRLINLELTFQDNEIRASLIYRSDLKPETVTVRNEIMTNLYEDQANMTIIRVGDFEEGIKFTSENTVQTFILK